MPPPSSLFLGFELAVEQLRVSIVDENLELVGVECVDFDTECKEYGTAGGIFTNPGEAYTTPVEMWIKALDLILEKLHRNHDLARVRAISGCAQHALVWWKSTTIPSLSSLDPHVPFHAHFPASSFSLPHTPTALDTSSHAHALAIESLLGGPANMSAVVGTSATPSLVAAQMLRVREGWLGEVWARTGRVQFASSFLSSLIMGKWASMVESEACATGMWVHSPSLDAGGPSHWSDQILDIIGGSREEGRRVRGWLGDVDTSGGRRVGSVSRYMIERYGFDPDTLVFPFIPHALGLYLSVSPALSPSPLPGDATINFGPIDTLMAPAITWNPSKLYQILPHPCHHPSSSVDSSSTTSSPNAPPPIPYVIFLSSRNADVPRALVRDMYTKSWSAFDRLVSVLSPGGSIGLDDKLFSFYHLQGDVYPFSHVKGIFRFETGVKVQEFRDLRANPRTLIESQVFGFRTRWADVVATGILGGSWKTLSTLGTGGLPGPTPPRLVCTGAAANFPSIISILSDIFNSTILVPATQLDAAQLPNEAHRNAPPKGYPGRASLGAAWFSRWGWGNQSASQNSVGVIGSGGTSSASSSSGSSPVWGEPPRRLSSITPSSLNAIPAKEWTSFEEEIRRLLSKRWVLSGATWGRTNVLPPNPTAASVPNQVGGTPHSTTVPTTAGGGPGTVVAPASSSGTSTPFGSISRGSSLAVFKEDDENITQLTNTLNRVVGGALLTPSLSSPSTSSFSLRASTTNDSLAGSGGSPSTAFTSPDPLHSPSLSSLVGGHPKTPTGPNAPTGLASPNPTGAAPTPLTPIVPMITPEGDAMMGMVKIGEADWDVHLIYGSIVPEFRRLEGGIVKGVV